MRIIINLPRIESEALTKLALSDRRTVDAVGEILLRAALQDCASVEDLRRKIDALPAESNHAPLPNIARHSGVIETLMAILEEAKRSTPLTIDELHQELVRRCGRASRNTVTAQLSRLPDERHFQIRKIKNGKEVRFAAE